MNTGILPPELKSLAQLFTVTETYQVPTYQRSFAWGDDEIEELWADVSSAAERETEYFLGTIVLQRVASDKFDIIDGQQRLTCLTMLASAVRNAFLSANDSRAERVQQDFLGSSDYIRNAPIVPKLVLNNVNNAVFYDYVVGSRNQQDIRAKLKDSQLDDSNRALLNAYSFLLDKVHSEIGKLGTDADQNFVAPLLRCLRSNIKLITITVTTGEDANLFFESLNARGKELAISDLVKNRVYAEARDQIRYAQQLWEKMEIELLRRSIPEYLRHYWIAKKATGNVVVREKQLYKLITNDVSKVSGAAISLLKDLSQSATDYVKIADFSLWPNDESYDREFEGSLDDLQLFRVTQCNPLLLNVIQNFPKSKDIAKVFRIVANFSFRYSIVGNQSPGNLEREMNKIAYDVRMGNLTTPEEIGNAFRALNPDSTFREDFAQVKMPRTRAKIARYILGRINNHMGMQESRSASEYVVNPNEKRVNLEHVFPQNPSNEWLKDIHHSIVVDEYIYRIGNLTLLNRNDNEDFGQLTFTDKKQVLSKSVLPINKYFKTAEKWNTDLAR